MIGVTSGRVAPFTALLTKPRYGIAYQRVPLTLTSLMGFGSARSLLSPFVMNVVSPSRLTLRVMTRWEITAGSPDVIWYVSTSPTLMSAIGVGLMMIRVPGGNFGAIELVRTVKAEPPEISGSTITRTANASTITRKAPLSARPM